MATSSFTPPSAEAILAQLLSNYSAICVSNGFSIGINPGSEIYTRFSAFAQQQAVLYNITAQQIDARMPDTATGGNLDRVLNQFGLQRKPASPSEGFIQLIASSPQSLYTGMLLSGPNGLQYQVTSSGVYQNSTSSAAITNPQLSYVPISCVNQGSNTDLGINQVLTWININPLMQSTTPVVIALTGGADAESDEQARFRLYQTLQNPPNAGNAQFLINLATSTDPIVQSGFVYPDYNGAGTQLIALMGYQSDGYYIGRDIPHLPTDNAMGGVSPYNSTSFNLGNNLVNDTSAILGQLPAIVANPYATTITTVNNMPTSISFGLSLPYPIGNPVNGFGSGWLNNNGQTWPVPDGHPYDAQNLTCNVSAVTSQTNITVQSYSITGGIDATNDPIPGLTLINWIDRSGGANKGWRIVQAKVLSFTKSSTVISHLFNYNIVLDTPLVCGITVFGQTDFYGEGYVSVNDPIFPASQNAQNYLNTVMNSYSSLGPGQVVDPTSLLAQLGTNRQPATGSIYSPILGTQFSQALTSNNSEIYSSPIIYNSTNSINNQPPISNPPTVFIPQYISWYDYSRINFS